MNPSFPKISPTILDRPVYSTQPGAPDLNRPYQTPSEPFWPSLTPPPSSSSFPPLSYLYPVPSSVAPPPEGNFSYLPPNSHTGVTGTKIHQPNAGPSEPRAPTSVRKEKRRLQEHQRRVNERQAFENLVSTFPGTINTQGSDKVTLLTHAAEYVRLLKASLDEVQRENAQLREVNAQLMRTFTDHYCAATNPQLTAPLSATAPFSCTTDRRPRAAEDEQPLRNKHIRF